MTARGWRGVVEAFRVEFGRRSWPRPGRPNKRRRGGTAPRCPQCELFVKQMCDEPYLPCGICTICCPGYDPRHKPAKKDPP